MDAWGEKAEKLFEKAMALNARGELFGDAKAKVTKVVSGLNPAVDHEGEDPEWVDCHDEDLDDDDEGPK